jgi:hypothetical protein
MKRNQCRRTNRNPGESGQAIVFVVLAMGLFLVGAVAFAVDMGNLWFHRQSAQSAADAACTAGAMDLLVDAQGGATGFQGFTNGTPFTCSAGSTAAPCKYAAFNGYNSSGTATSGNQVSVNFPTAASVPGLPSSSIPSASAVPTAFMGVVVTDNVQTYFSGLLSGQRTQPVRGSAICGVISAASPIPILILDPQSPNSSPQQAALNIQGSGAIKIVGGPIRSIQVNSSAAGGSCGQSNCSANQPWGSATIDLSLGGPNGTGSDIGLYGAPASPPSGFITGSTSHWIAPAAPISDPFAQVCAPGQTGCPAINGNTPPAIPSTTITIPADETSKGCASVPCKVAYQDHGCPDPSATKANGNCLLYFPGHYTANIQVKNKTVALFDPGLYYLDAGLTMNSNSTVRPGTGAGDLNGGTTFYFKGTSTITVDSNSGKQTGFDPFNTQKGPVTLGGVQYPDDALHTNKTYKNGVQCLTSSSIPPNLVATNIPSDPTKDGASVLFGPCTGYYGDPKGASAAVPPGEQRGFLFFQDRSARDVNPSWGGGGQFLLAGTMYFHSCNASGTGEGCGSPPTYFNDIFQMQGNSGSGTYVLGNIVADNLTLGGTSGITMDLNPTSSYNQLKATLLR